MSDWGRLQRVRLRLAEVAWELYVAGAITRDEREAAIEAIDRMDLTAIRRLVLGTTEAVQQGA